MWDTQIPSLGWEGPLEKEWLPTPVSLPGQLQEQRSLVGYSPWGCKETDMTEQLTVSLRKADSAKWSTSGLRGICRHLILEVEVELKQVGFS